MQKDSECKECKVCTCDVKSKDSYVPPKHDEKILIIAKKDCPNCATLKGLLNKNNIRFFEITNESSPEEFGYYIKTYGFKDAPSMIVKLEDNETIAIDGFSECMEFSRYYKG